MAPASKSKNFAVESAFMNELVTLFSDSDLTTLELETDEIAVKLSRGSEGATVMMPQMAQMGQPFAAAPGAPATPAAPAPGQLGPAGTAPVWWPPDRQRRRGRGPAALRPPARR